MNLLEAIERRVSVRSYDERPVDPEHLERLTALSQTAGHLTDVRPRVELISGAERAQRVLTYMIGSYGLVLTPPHLLVGVMPTESEIARLDLGYVLEQVVLEATRLGLGTCWITGTYDAQSAGDAVGLTTGEVAAAVVALGTPSERGWGRIHTSAIRRLAGGHKRKPLEEIVFAGRWGKPWSPEEAAPMLVSVLEHARLAPSAANRQPWRFIIRPKGLALAVVEPKPIDAGIVMAHVALAAEALVAGALGHAGQWHVHWRDAALAQACGLPQGAVPVAIFS
jgi:nitroreductase